MRNHQDNNSDYEPNLKDLVHAIKAHYLELRKYWLLLGVIGILGVIYFVYEAMNHIPKYNANLTFMVNEDSGGGVGGMASGLLGQLGLGGGGGEYNLDKMMSLLKSRHITEQVLFKKETINDNEDYLANHIINNLDTLNKWAHVSWYMKPLADMEKVERLKTFRFQKDSMDFTNKLENNVLKNVYSALVGSPDSKIEPILNSKYSETTAILELSASSYDDELAIALANRFFEGLSSFYVEKTTEKQRLSYDVMTDKRDSLEAALRSSQYQLATFQDENRNTFKKTSKLTEIRLQSNMTICIAALTEVVKNHEFAGFTLQNETPRIQIIDRPIAPIRPSKKSKIKAIIVGGIMGLFFGMLFVVLRKMVRDALED